MEDVPGAEPESVAAAPVAAAEPEKKKKKKDKKRKKKDADEGGAAVPDAATDVPVLATSAYRPLNADGSIAITYDTLAGTLGGNQVDLARAVCKAATKFNAVQDGPRQVAYRPVGLSLHWFTHIDRCKCRL